MTALIPEDQVQAASQTEEVDGVMIRTPTDIELADVIEEWSRPVQRVNVDVDRIQVDLTNTNPVIQFGEHEAPSTDMGMESLLRYLGMPVKYVMDAPADEQEFMINHRVHRADESRAVFEFTSDGISFIRDSKKFFADPGEMAERIGKKMPLESPVRDYWLTPEELRLDVYMPLDDTRYSGGDRAVGDITKGGIRLTQNRKQNLMPQVNGYLQRLACTNGMEITDNAFRIEGRRGDLDETFGVEFESMVMAAFSQIDGAIEAFYDMRNQRVEDDRTGTLRRIALDAGLSSLVAGRLEDQVAQLDNPTMFDFVNLITNQANRVPRAGAARTLQRAGGGLLEDHAARCSQCHHKLV